MKNIVYIGNRKKSGTGLTVLFFILNVVAANSFYNTLNAQTTKGTVQPLQTIDSLLAVLKYVDEDTNKVNALNLLAWEQLNKAQYAEVEKNIKEALQLSEKLNFALGKAKALNNSALLIMNTGNIDDGIKQGLEALAICKKSGNKKQIANTCNTIGVLYRNSGNPEKSLEYHNEALKLRLEIGDKKGLAASYTSLGLLLHFHGKYAEALKHLYAGLKISEELGDKRACGNIYNNIALVYDVQENYSEALKFHTKALEIRTELGDKASIATSYSNIGTILSSMGNNEEALKNLFLSLELRKAINNVKGMASSYNNIAIVYKHLDKNKEALDNYSKALTLLEKIGEKDALATCYTTVAPLYLELKRPADAKRYLLKALAISLESENAYNVMFSFKGLAKTDSAAGDFKEAFKHYKLYILYKDSIVNEENTKKTVQMEMQYDFDKKSAADSIKNVETKKFEEIKHQQEISRQKTFTYGGIAGFLVMIIVAGISFIAFRNKKKANIEIQHQKELVEEKQKEILDSIYYARRIQRALITSEKYIYRNLNRLRK
ncbi:MAG: tetratricopeptide repeat protein [Bacteroidia bacterium]|nr:tetratricopeptide repeat protein [Bacteroidia bacterium]